MKNFITTLISALVAAVIVTELYSRVFPNSRLALFLLAFIAIAGVALYNVRLAAVRHAAALAGASAVGATGNRPPRTRNNPNKSGGAKNDAQSNNPGGGARGGRNNARDAKSAAGNRDDKPASADAKPSRAPAVVPDGPRESGSVKWFNRSKGFGFIIRDNGEEIFVHHRSIRNSDDSRRANLRDGQKVSYVVADHDKGQQAEDVVGE